jgi:hypothetical protein
MAHMERHEGEETLPLPRPERRVGAEAVRAAYCSSGINNFFLWITPAKILGWLCHGWLDQNSKVNTMFSWRLTKTANEKHDFLGSC